MKLFLVVACATLAYAAPGRLENTYLPPVGAASSGGTGLAVPYHGPSEVTSRPPVAILKSTNNNSPDGSYSFSYETEDGTTFQESGQIKNPDSAEEAFMTVEGSYSYVTPDGVTITVTFTADKNGFQPQGAHLPTPPPIPEAIARSLEFIAAAEAKKAKAAEAVSSNGYSASATGQHPGYNYLPPQ